MSANTDELVTRTDHAGGTHHELHSDEGSAPAGTLAAPVTVSDIPAICQRVIAGAPFTSAERSTVAVVVHAWTKRDLRNRSDSALARAYLAIETPDGISPTLASASANERIAYASAAKRRANAWRTNTTTATTDKDSE